MTVPVSTSSHRSAALGNGFLVLPGPKVRDAFLGRAVSVSGSAISARISLSLAGLLIASASGPLTLAAAVAVASTAASTTSAPLVLVALLIATNICHEFGHLVALGVVSRSRPHVHVVAQLGFAHIVRPRLAPVREVIVVTAGPCAVVVACVTLMLVAAHPVAAIILGAIGAGHLATLALPTGDGANLRDAVGRMRTRR